MDIMVVAIFLGPVHPPAFRCLYHLGYTAFLAFQNPTGFSVYFRHRPIVYTTVFDTCSHGHAFASIRPQKITPEPMGPPHQFRLFGSLAELWKNNKLRIQRLQHDLLLSIPYFGWPMSRLKMPISLGNTLFLTPNPFPSKVSPKITSCWVIWPSVIK